MSSITLAVTLPAVVAWLLGALGVVLVIGLLVAAYFWLGGRIWKRHYARHIAAGLDRAYASAAVVDFDVDRNAAIVFSDHHRGERDAADDFTDSEAVYRGALVYYYELGHQLFIVGDAEELWEVKNPNAPLTWYQEALALERRFNAVPSRYIRIYGNHDEYWSKPGHVERCLEPVLGPVRVHEAVRLRIRTGDEVLGEIFITHGHQGTFESEHTASLSRIAVRLGWRWYQLKTKIRLNTPAKDYQLRSEHNHAMYAWALARSRRKRVVLVAGHTHQPVSPDLVDPTLAQHEFEYIQDVETEVGQLLQESRDRPEDRDSRRQLAEKRAYLEYLRAQTVLYRHTRLQERPVYFNTGCCSFLNGDVTGVEIANGNIGVVRWRGESGKRDDVGRPWRLTELFAQNP